MNIQEYIQSGALDLYAMGALAPEEMREVEELAAAHPEIGAEIALIEQTLGDLATSVARTPRSGLKQEILGRIGSADPPGSSAAPPGSSAAPPGSSAAPSGSSAAPSGSSAAPSGSSAAPPGSSAAPSGSSAAPSGSSAAPSGSSAAPSAAQILPMTPPPSPALAHPSGSSRSYLVAASVLVGLIGMGLALYYGSRLDDVEGQLAEALQQRNSVAAEATAMREQLRKVETNMVVLRNPEYRLVMMKGTENAPGAEAIVHWHPASRQVFLDIKAMPAPPAGHQYQLWALTEAGPVDAGMFDSTAEVAMIDMKPMKQVETATAFAVTIEPMGGSPSPTLEKMVANGTL